MKSEVAPTHDTVRPEHLRTTALLGIRMSRGDRPNGAKIALSQKCRIPLRLTSTLFTYVQPWGCPYGLIGPSHTRSLLLSRIPLHAGSFREEPKLVSPLSADRHLLTGASSTPLAALGLPLWAYWPISHEILTPKDYSTARWVPQRGTQVSLSPVSR